MEQQLNSRQKRMIRRSFLNVLKDDVKDYAFLVAVILFILLAGFAVGTMQVKGF